MIPPEKREWSEEFIRLRRQYIASGRARPGTPDWDYFIKGKAPTPPKNNPLAPKTAAQIQSEKRKKALLLSVLSPLAICGLIHGAAHGAFFGIIGRVSRTRRP